MKETLPNYLLVIVYILQMILQSRLDLCRQVTDAVARKRVSLIVFVGLLQRVSSDCVVILLA
jgi:hypothetical protein